MKKAFCLKTSLFCLLFTVCANSQSKKESKIYFVINPSAIFVEKDFGFATGLGIGYNLNKRTSINIGGMHAQLENKDSDLKYNLQKLDLNFDYAFFERGGNGISSVVGISYLFFDNKLGLDKNSSIGIDLGIKTNFNVNQYFDYGFTLINTYSPSDKGGIFNAGLFLKLTP